jgi:hydrogenase-4 component C
MLLVGILQTVLVLVLAPLFSGLARVLRAKMHSRRGPSIFQNYYDIFKLLRRQEVRPACATWVFMATPFVVLAAASTLAMLIPMWTLQAPLGVAGDFLVVIYCLA